MEGNSNPTQAQKILEILQLKGTVTNAELNDRVCFRYGARIHELRRLGYVIRTTRIKQGLWTFTYEGRRAPRQVVMRRPAPKVTNQPMQLSLV